jgi:hypothetical protein
MLKRHKGQQLRREITSRQVIFLNFFRSGGLQPEGRDSDDVVRDLAAGGVERDATSG